MQGLTFGLKNKKIPVRTLFFSTLVFCLMSAVGNAVPASSGTPTTLRLSQRLLAEAINNTLPIEINATSQRLQGSLTILAIDDLQLSDNQLHCILHLKGNQLQFATEVAEHEIRLKISTMDINLDSSATLRFAPEEQILFIRPVITKKPSAPPHKGPDIGQALTILINSKEFPITRENLAPLLAKAAGKKVTPTARIDNITIEQGELLLFFAPENASN